MRATQVGWLSLAMLLGACGGSSGTPGPDGGTTPDAGDAAVAPDAAWPLQVTVETPDGLCADLSLTDRPTPAVRFHAQGPAGATVALWADKPACDATPFHYRDVTLDASGYGSYELHHGGSDDCADNLLGRWQVWLEHAGQQSDPADVLFSSGACGLADDCAKAQGFCPQPETGPLIPANELFVLTPAERARFTPPPDWLEWGTNWEDYPLRNLWEAFDAGGGLAPLAPDAGPAGWYNPDGTGSQNHALLWLGVAALAYGLAGDVAMFEDAAGRCLTVLDLDTLQGHMRHEAVGQYAGFWEGGIATMALAGLYAPAGSLSGGALLAAARSWWADHIAVLRQLSVDDGQVALLGARIPGDVGVEDSWASLSAAVNLQLLDPRPHGALHPTIAGLITASGEPDGPLPGVAVRWDRPRHVSERWVVLRAVQSGALPPVPATHPAPPVVQEVFRWTAAGRTHVATPLITGYRPARWYVSWAAGSVVRVEVGDPYGITSGKGPHPPPAPLDIPPTATRVLGPSP